MQLTPRVVSMNPRQALKKLHNELHDTWVDSYAKDFAEKFLDFFQKIFGVETMIFLSGESALQIPDRYHALVWNPKKSQELQINPNCSHEVLSSIFENYSLELCENIYLIKKPAGLVFKFTWTWGLKDTQDPELGENSVMRPPELWLFFDNLADIRWIRDKANREFLESCFASLNVYLNLRRYDKEFEVYRPLLD